MSQIKPNVQLDYNVPATFKRSPDGKVLLIEGIAIDDTVNSNMWQVPAEELPFFVANGQFAQIRVDHGDKVEDVKGTVNILGNPQLSEDGRNFVSFKGEVSGDEELLTKIEREYVDSVSPRVSGEAYCSACGNRSRDDQMNLVHICRGAWEVMRHPTLVELSIVSKGAYEHTKFKPAGFAAAMNANQQKFIAKALTVKQKKACTQCAGGLTLDCLNCTSQVPFTGLKAGEINQNKGEKNKMSAEGSKPLDAEAVEAIISKHAEALAEACKKAEEEAKKAAEACKSETEASVKKAIESAKEAVKIETAALMAKMEDFVNKALKQRAPGKGVIGNLNEHQEPQKLQGMVAVPPYFKELAAAAKKKRSFDAQFNQAGVE